MRGFELVYHPPVQDLAPSGVGWRNSGKLAILEFSNYLRESAAIDSWELMSNVWKMNEFIII